MAHNNHQLSHLTSPASTPDVAFVASFGGGNASQSNASMRGGYTSKLYETDYGRQGYTQDDLLDDLIADMAQFTDDAADAASVEEVTQRAEAAEDDAVVDPPQERRRPKPAVSEAAPRRAEMVRLSRICRGASLLRFIRVQLSSEGNAKLISVAIAKDLGTCRPYFTLWMTSVQLVLLIASLVAFGFAPVGVTSGLNYVADMKDKNHFTVKVCALDYHNLFLGPRMSDLIRVGAKYSLCMRRYDTLYQKILDPQLRDEDDSGCCVHNDGSACYQSQKVGCPSQMSTWLRWTNSSPGPDGRISGPVCGLDPRTCEEPRSLPGQAWPDRLTGWPVCQRQQSDNATKLSEIGAENAHLACPISARPCCVGIKGECVITSQQRCDFMRGNFYPDRQLCSQVNCLAESCGMLGVSDRQNPNQFYRVLTSLFLHSGVVTLAVTIVHHLLFLRRLEQNLGWHRTACIYIGSGVIGNLVSMIFLPYLVDVGPASAQIGSLAPILIEMGMSWHLVDNKLRPLCLFILAPLVLLTFGFFPWFDNFANLGGLISGCLLSVVLMPYIHYGSSERSALVCRRISVAVCLTVWLTLLVGLFLAFYLAPLASCDFCVYFNCGPKWFDRYFTDQSYVDYCGYVNLSNPEPTKCIETLSDAMT